jgi:hypothetical protein
VNPGDPFSDIKKVRRLDRAFYYARLANAISGQHFINVLELYGMRPPPILFQAFTQIHAGDSPVANFT